MNQGVRWYVAAMAARTGNIKTNGIHPTVNTTYDKRAAKKERDEVGEARIVSRSSER